VYALHINFRMAQPVSMKLGMYSMAPESVSTAHFINPSHQSVYLYAYPLSLLGNSSIKSLSRQQIYMQQQNC
jgi:hypothetical protein